jgi:GTP-binding protein
MEARGTLFIGVGAKVYAGMVVGESSKEIDIEINPAKAKAFTNVRTVSKDDKVKLTPPRQMSLEEAISYIRGTLITTLVSPIHLSVLLTNYRFE